jgi:HAD superfamily hydrolase (TIGR01509 family)
MSRHALETYLTDHLAGSRVGLQLIDRCQGAHRERPELQVFLSELQEQVVRDRRILRSMLLRMDGSPSAVKEAGARLLQQGSRMTARELAEAAGPGLLELLEALALGVSRTRHLWEALEAASGGTGRFGGVELGELRQRAEEQHHRVEAWRREVAREVFVEAGDPDRPEAPDELRGVLLDLDGTLLASNEAHARAWVDALRESDPEVRYEVVRPLIGLDGGRFIAAAADVEPEGEEARRISDRHTERYLERYLPGCQATPGARALVERLLEEGLTVCAATSSRHAEARATLEAAGVADLVPCATSADDVERGKPHPEMLHTALEAAGLAAEEAILVGDTPYDVQAGLEAGVAVVAVRCGGSGDAELSGAVAIYDDPAGVREGWERGEWGSGARGAAR